MVVNLFIKLNPRIKNIEDIKTKDATIHPLVADIKIIMNDVIIIKFRYVLLKRVSSEHR